MATAAWLTSLGHAVTLCDTPEQAEDFDAIKAQGGILLDGALADSKPHMPARLTTDFAGAADGADVILICVSAQRQLEILPLLAPHTNDGQLILLIPGNMGSVYYRRELDALGKRDVVVAEMCGNLWACRRAAPGHTLVAMPAGAKFIAAYPDTDTSKATAALEGVLEVKPAANIIEVTLNSPNIITHVAGTILNAVQIEKKGDDFALFMDGLSESYITCTNRVEAERNGLLDKMGLHVLGDPCEGLHRTLMKDEVPPALAYFKKLEGPSSFSHRYVAEDAACGLALMVSLAHLFDVPAPFTESCLLIAGVINGTDYLQTGRTAQNLELQVAPA